MLLLAAALLATRVRAAARRGASPATRATPPADRARAVMRRRGEVGSGNANERRSS
ncbi:hypothetical protein [Burkholderia sp. MSMB1459WGS]|uniref:hypothetical protein n=1 Tax=Burkholderia sp. MSMB1459WGS TaxID=1637970 RepID=UPI000B20864E|nr:hypothetical protein [Burkholderia sp. MSMB1459WGS]